MDSPSGESRGIPPWFYRVILSRVIRGCSRDFSRYYSCILGVLERIYSDISLMVPPEFPIGIPLEVLWGVPAEISPRIHLVYFFHEIL